MLGSDHADLAVSAGNVGQALDAQRKYTEAEALYREALAVGRRALGSEHPDVATYLIWLSGTELRSGKPVAAEATAREAFRINLLRLGADHPRTIEAEGALGMALCNQRRWGEAEKFLIRYATALKERSDVDGDVTVVAQQAVDMYVALGKPREADTWRARLRE